MRKWIPNVLLVVSLAAGLVPATGALGQPPAALAAADAEASPEPPLAMADRSLGDRLVEVPDEVKNFFEGGIPAEEFVARTGYVPRALEGLVEGDALMVIELEGEPLAAVVAEAGMGRQSLAPPDLDAVRDGLLAQQDSIIPQIEALGAEIVSQYTTVYNGLQARVPYARLNEIRALPGVVAVHPAPVHEPALGASVPLIGAPDVWAGPGYDGTGVTIAIIDTGIDYTHAAFGGPGTELSYEINDPDVIEPTTFPTTKVVGGYDFVGTLYDAGCTAAEEDAGTCTTTAIPDPDPLDEQSHGTHVASISAGLSAGQVMTGVAPGASLLALKVFGRDGSTTFTADALEWATLQYIYTGAPQVINMSLGSPWGSADDVSVVASNNAASVGIMVVASAGNEGDSSYITGSPGVADRALSVAASTTGFATGPTVDIVGTSYVTQTDIIYTPSSFDAGGSFDASVQAPLGYVGNIAAANTLCSTDGIAPNALSGQVALISRGACAFSQKANNAASLGAVAALIYNNTSGIISMIGTPVSIPAASLQQQDGLNLIPADGQDVLISAESDVESVVDPYTPADTIASFSSRGPRGTDSKLKPEITAPGVAIFAADMGTGDRGVSKGGTSMAAPHIAGVAALLTEANPSWSPEQIKAAMMNTAVPMADDTSIPRSGAGRVDALAAAQTEVIAIGDEYLVSANWGLVLTSDDMITGTKQVTVYNDGGSAATYDVAADFQTGSLTDGAALSVDPTQVTVPAGNSEMVTLTLMLDMMEAPVNVSSTLEEYYGFVTFTPQGGGDDLVVPFYLHPRPFAELEVEADTTIFNPPPDLTTVEITHTGPVTSSLWMYPALVSNDMPTPGVEGPGDVRMFGLDWGGLSPYGGIVVAAINAWDSWHTPQPYFAEFDLYLDVDEDGTDDFVDFNWNYGWYTGGDDNNVWVVVQVDLSDGMVYLGSPYTIYTDFNSSFMEWYLPDAWNGMSSINSDFVYQLIGFDVNGNASSTPQGTFDFNRPPLNWALSDDPGPYSSNAMGVLEVNDAVGYLQSAPEGAMLVDYVGDPSNSSGSQAYFLPLELGGAYLNAAHLAPFAPAGAGTAVTVTLNGVPAITNFWYGDSTGYLAVEPDTYLVEVFPGGSATPAITASVQLEQGKFYTAVAVGDGVNQDLGLIAAEDDLTAPAAGKFHLRLGHAAPFAAGGATADIRLQDGTPVLENVNFGDLSAFIPLDAGEYDLKITTPGGAVTLIDPAPVTFNAGEIVTALASGEDNNADLGVFAMPEGGTSFFLPLTTYTMYFPVLAKNYTSTYLQVAHLAPFAMDPGTAVTVTLNGATALTDVAYGDSTGYLELPAGEYLVEIFPGSSTTAAISATVDLMGDMHYTAIAAGDGANQDLQLIAVEDDLTPPESGKFHLRLGHMAPFASGDALADIRLQDGTPVLTDVAFSNVSAFIPLDAGTYDLKITTPGGGTTLIDPDPVTFADGDLVSAFATGEGSNQDLGVFALPAGSPGAFLPLAAYTYVQVAHLAPFAADPNTVVTVTLNGVPAIPNFAYGDSTAYVELEPDTYLVEVFPAGSATAAITASVDLMEDTYYTVIAAGDGVNQDLQLIAVEDDLTAPASGKFHVRLGHMAPFASGDALADIRLQDGTPVLTNVAFGDISPFIPLDAGPYDLKITTPGGGTTLIDPAPATFSEGDLVTAFATGEGSNQDLGVFALPSGSAGAFLPLATYLQVAHLAPFAADPGTVVTVTLNGAVALQNVAYGDSTAYLPLAADTYLVEIFPAGSATAAITANVDLMEGTYYTAIAAGDGSNQDLQLIAVEDDLTAPAAGKFHLRLGHMAPFASGDALADIRLQDGTPVLTDVAFSNVSAFIPLDAGTYDLKITTPGGGTTLIDPAPATFSEGDLVTAFATGEGSNQDLGVFALPAGSPGAFLTLAAYLQVAHLAPFAADPNTVVTVTLDGLPALQNFAYGDSTEYLSLAPDTYLVEIFPGSSATAAITANVELMEGTYYTAIAAGDGVNQDLQLIAVEDDLTAPAAGKFHLRLGHMAPFASGDALADVRLDDDTVILDDVAFGVIGAFVPLDAGTYDLKITTPDGTTTLIDPDAVTFAEGDLVTAFATGEGTNQALGVFAMPPGTVGGFLPLE